MSERLEIWYWRSLKLKLVNIFLSILAIFALLFGLYKIYCYSEKILPETVQINIVDPEIREKVRTDVSGLMNLSNDKKQTRSEFLKEMSGLLNGIDFIN